MSLEDVTAPNGIDVPIWVYDDPQLNVTFHRGRIARTKNPRLHTSLLAKLWQPA